MKGSLTAFRRRLLAWYHRHRRDLPWRIPAADQTAVIDPYHVLVSELMLQQTQVSTVVPYFCRFIERFRDLESLATANTGDVLRLWQGLGYYSRARNLQRAAQKAVRDFGGELPNTVSDLLTLPGVGRYTAGAIASLAFGHRAPILDGNVTRVLCRLDQITTDPRDRATQEILWTRAENILPQTRIGDFNSALMELGALVCTPRSPQCLLCPINQHCDAYATGLQERIPAPKKAKPTPLVLRRTFCIRQKNRWLIEKRPEKGRWAGLWQFITVESDPAQSPIGQLRREKIANILSRLQPLGVISHALTHRRYQFEAFTIGASSETLKKSILPRQWVTLDELDKFPLSRPQLQIAGLLRAIAK